MDNRMNYECIGIFKMSRLQLFTFCGIEHYSRSDFVVADGYATAEIASLR